MNYLTKEEITTQILSVPTVVVGIENVSISSNFIVIFHWIVYTFVCQATVFFGIGTNIVNIICFVKQGFKDPVNISLLGLAFSDLGSLITLVWLNISFTPAFMDADLPFDTFEFQYLFGGMLHASFTRVSGWITAVVTLERCLCIMLPLQVKRIVTPKRVTVIIVSVFIILFGSGTPIYLVNRLGWKFFPGRNKTLIGLLYTKNRDNVEKISYALNNTCIPFSSFIVIAIGTITLVTYLHKMTKWRQESMIILQVDNRNEKAAKMIVMISSLFIACFIPVCITFMAMSLDPELSFEGKHRNILSIIGGFGIVLESISSSVNIFFYYNMSSKYKLVFCQLFRTKLGK